MKEYKVSVQSLIDHIKTSLDVDPWAQEMAEELLKKQIPRPVHGEAYARCGLCNVMLMGNWKYCAYCGQAIEWSDMYEHS